VLARQVAASLLVILITVAAFGRQQPRMKGYELYSWKHNGHWHYSLLVGTNRSKSFEEITSSKTAHVGTAALISELKKLPRGEEILWMSDVRTGVAKPHNRAFSLELPSRQRIKRVKAHCEKLGIRLKLM
jgi:hypothetical protein